MYYRLSVFPLTIPPLRARKEDIGLLAEHFVAKHGPRVGTQVDRIPAAAVRKLQEYDWPGNVRELENVIERALIVSSGRERIRRYGIVRTKR